MKIHVAAVALNTTPIAWKESTANINEALLDAHKQGIQLAVLPELCVTGYGCEDLFFHPFVRETALNIVLTQLPKLPDMIYTVGLPLEHAGALYNVVAVIMDGSVKGFYAKQNLAGDGVHYEPRWFKPWPKGSTVNCKLPNGETVPLGDTTFTTHFNGTDITFGFEICEDAWVADRPGIALSKAAVDIILNPSASHFAFGKSKIRELFVVDGSRTFNCGYIYANLLGNEAGRIVYDGECLIANAGKIIVKGKRFGYAPYRITSAVVDLSLNRFNRLRSVSFHSHTRPLTQVGGLKPAPKPVTPPAAPKPGFWDHEYPGNEKLQEFLGAQTLALFDYVRKTRTSGFVISKSGGSDSALCALLVHEMVRLGHTGDANDREAFDKVFPLPEGAAPATSRTRAILTLIYQGAANSSAETLRAAEAIANDVGAAFHNFGVTPVVDLYEDFLRRYLGRTLNWTTDDVPRQNLQARVRAPLPWLIANVENKLLVTTSNRSEAAVGYCTMDGDTAGSIGPIEGIDKPFVLEALDAMASRYTGIALVRAKPPTAELKPADANQTDEVDLMPYPVLDAIEQASVLEGKAPREIVASGVGTKTQVSKFFTLFARNQWKRERYAPSFMLDSRNLDPRSFTRFPILNGGFCKEIADLK